MAKLAKRLADIGQATIFFNCVIASLVYATLAIIIQHKGRFEFKGFVTVSAGKV